MIITYLGGEFVKVQFGDITLAVNPPSKESTLKAPRFGADVVLISLNHPDMNGVDSVGIGSKQPFVIQGPGEYEIKDVVVRGFPTESQYNKEKRINTVYTVTLEGMKLCFLGALSSPDLPAELKEELDEVDVLFVPVGGEGVLLPAAAEKLAVALEPHLIIPVHFEGMGAPGALRQFLKEAGEEKTASQDKLTLKKKDLEGKEGEVVVLKAGS
jgi:hypothetical protein